MSIESALATVLPDRDHITEATMLQALVSILRTGTVCAQRADALLAASSAPAVEEAGQHFASRSLQWLAQQSVLVTTPIWRPDRNAQH